MRIAARSKVPAATVGMAGVEVESLVDVGNLLSASLLRPGEELEGQCRFARGGSFPLFARHDRGAGKRVLGISERSAEYIVERWAVAALGEEARGTITPHTFRHSICQDAPQLAGGRNGQRGFGGGSPQ